MEVTYNCGHIKDFGESDFHAIKEIEALIPLTEHGECPKCREARIRKMLDALKKAHPNF